MLEAIFSDQFLKATKKIDKVALREACEEIATEPYAARGSETLSYDWAGFRSAKFDSKNRIIFRVCEECVQKQQQELSPLPCCLDPDGSKDVIWFVDFGDYHAGAGRRRLKPSKSYSAPTPEPSQ